MAIAVPLLAAAALWRNPRAVVVVVAGLVALAFAALDLREAANQADEHRASLEALAVLVVALHVGAAGAALALVRTGRRSPAASQRPGVSSRENGATGRPNFENNGDLARRSRTTPPYSRRRPPVAPPSPRPGKAGPAASGLSDLLVTRPGRG